MQRYTGSEKGSAVVHIVDTEGLESSFTLRRTTYGVAMKQATDLMNQRDVVTVDVDFLPTNHPVTQEQHEQTAKHKFNGGLVA